MQLIWMLWSSHFLGDGFHQADDGGFGCGKAEKFGRGPAAPGPLRTIIFPERRSIMCGSTALQAFMTPRRLI